MQLSSQISNLLKFLERVDLKGSEAAAFCQARDTVLFLAKQVEEAKQTKPAPAGDPSLEGSNPADSE